MKLRDAKVLGINLKQDQKVLVISPFSRVTKNKTLSPKDYPYWEDVVRGAKLKGYYVIQVGITGEKEIGADEILFNQTLKYLSKLIKFCDKWISVDNFFHHLAWYNDVPGIVIWGPSDPRIFGHDINLNILKDRKYLRIRQFGEWHEIPHVSHIFPSASFILEEL